MDESVMLLKLNLQQVIDNEKNYEVPLDTEELFADNDNNKF